MTEGTTEEVLSHSRSVCSHCCPGTERILRKKRQSLELIWACDSDWSIISQIPIRSLIKAAWCHMQWNRSSFSGNMGTDVREHWSVRQLKLWKYPLLFAERGNNAKVKAFNQHPSINCFCFLILMHPNGDLCEEKKKTFRSLIKSSVIFLEDWTPQVQSLSPQWVCSLTRPLILGLYLIF